ncbi:hypothetical protein T439DRAFT_300728 [Meredithblackwellia eburnea MCA 4105]
MSKPRRSMSQQTATTSTTTTDDEEDHHHLDESVAAGDLGSSKGAQAPTSTSSFSAVQSLKLGPNPASWSYFAILTLFRFVLRVFYANVVVEGSENLPPDGVPCILCSNHSNSLTDALLLVTTVPRSKRHHLRLTAKDTQFGRGTFTSWLIESAGTLPIKRPKDHVGQKIDNSVVFAKLIESLEEGDIVCIFPEGLSRYHPEIAALRQGVSRIVSDVVSRQRSNPNFELAIQTCSITYLHRNLFRSDVLVTFHPPIKVTAAEYPGLIGTPETPADYAAVRDLTSKMGREIRAGTLDAPSWDFIRTANTARRLYAPLGTKLGLGDHVRLTQRFVDAFAGKRAVKGWSEGTDAKLALKTPMVDPKEGSDYFAALQNASSPESSNGQEVNVMREGSKGPHSAAELDLLAKDLKTYQDLLFLHGVKDDRVRNPRMLLRRTLLKRLLVRFAGAAFLLLLSLPGLVLWTPIFAVAKIQSEKQKRTGPVFDTYDEVAQTKLVYGLITGIGVYLLSVLLTWPIAPLTMVGVPVLMWITLRWLEDFTSSLRAALALFRLLHLGKHQLLLLREMRESLRVRVEEVAVRDCGLPRDSDVYLVSRGRWRGLHAGFFSLNRRRKKDWNEVLKLWDISEYPANDYPEEDATGTVPKVAGGATN